MVRKLRGFVLYQNEIRMILISRLLKLFICLCIIEMQMSVKIITGHSSVKNQYLFTFALL